MITVTLAAAILAVAPTINFTSDSVYKKESIIDYEVVAKTETKTSDTEPGRIDSSNTVYILGLAEKYSIGYEIYDDPETDWVDGIRIDGETISSEDWCYEFYDLEHEFTITVKTVYTDDIAGWLARAKSGDFSAIFANPVTFLQFGYYILAAASIVLGGFGLLKSKKRKAKTAAEIAVETSKQVGAQSEVLKAQALELIQKAEDHTLDLTNTVVTYLVEKLNKQNDTLIKATVLARSGDEKSTLALLDLLKNSETEGVEDLSEAVRNRIQEFKAAEEQAKVKALQTMQEAVAAIPVSGEEPNDGYDGTSI